MDVVQCLICGEKFTRLERHLRVAHGLSVKDYKEKFQHAAPTTAAEQAREAGKLCPTKDLVTLAMQELNDDERESVLAEASLRVYRKDEQEWLKYNTTVLANVRLKLFQQEVGIMGKILAELSQPWRLKMTESGEPLSTKDLVNIGNLIQTAMKYDQEAILRLMGHAVNDNRGVLSRPQASDEMAFKGDADTVRRLEQEFSPQERERIRNLIEVLQVPGVKKSVIDGEVVAGKPATDEGRNGEGEGK